MKGEEGGLHTIVWAAYAQAATGQGGQQSVREGSLQAADGWREAGRQAQLLSLSHAGDGVGRETGLEDPHKPAMCGVEDLPAAKVMP